MTVVRKAEQLGDQGLMGNILKELCVSANRQEDFPKSVSYGYQLMHFYRGSNLYSIYPMKPLKDLMKLGRRHSADYFIIALYELKVAMRDSFGLPFASITLESFT